MNKETFHSNFKQALAALLELTKQHCHNEISEDFRFIIEPSGRDTHSGLNEFEKGHLKELNRNAHAPLSEKRMMDLLWQNNKVPLWINMTITESRMFETSVHLLVSRRLRSEEELFRKAMKFAPFNVLVPLPPDNVKKDKNGKFDINWKKQLSAKKDRIYWSPGPLIKLCLNLLLAGGFIWYCLYRYNENHPAHKVDPRPADSTQVIRP